MWTWLCKYHIFIAAALMASVGVKSYTCVHLSTMNDLMCGQSEVRQCPLISFPLLKAMAHQ